MKWLFLVILAVASVLMAIALGTAPSGRSDGVPVLVWATDDNPARQEQMALFRQWHEERYGEPVDIRIDPSNYDRAKIVTQSLAGVGPDVFDFFGAAALERFVRSGIILDVTEEARAKGFSPDIVWEGIRPSFVWEGRQYGFPDNTCGYILIYHKDMLEAAGVPLPPAGGWTWAEFLETAGRLSFRRPDGLRQFALIAADPLEMIFQNGGELFSPGGTRCILDSPEAVEAIRFYEDLRSRWHVMPTAGDLASMASAGGWGGGSDPLNQFAAKFCAMAWAGRYWFIGFDRDTGAALKQGKPPPFRFGVAPVPYFRKAHGRVGARCTGISRTSPRIAYAKRFLEFLASEPFNRQINRSYDSLATVKKYCTDDRGISDGRPPPPGLEAANDPLWLAAMTFSEEVPTSPFLSPYRVETLWWEEKGRLDAGDVTPEECLRRFVRLVNEEIERNVAENPPLAKRYAEALAKEPKP